MGHVRPHFPILEMLIVLQRLTMQTKDAWELMLGNGSSEIITLKMTQREPEPDEPQMQNQLTFPSSISKLSGTQGSL